MKRNLVLRASLLPIFVLLYGTVLGQSHKHTLTGQVVDSLSGQPVAYATVTVMTPEMKPVNAVAADMTGKFTLPVKESGDFKLVISFVGYNTHTSDLSVGEEAKKLDLGKISITEGVEIGEVVVAVQKPLIQVDAEKLTYSVEADPESEYSTLAEILRKVPQLSVDAEDNVLLNGQSDYKVLVNGKSSTLMSNNFKDVIKSMPANSVKDIQVITDPSTKYEADGVGGIINIITNRNSSLNGYSGRIGGGYGSFGDYNADAYISAQFGKFSVSTSYWLGKYNIKSADSFSESYNFKSEESYLTRTATDGHGYELGQGLFVEASYEIDTFNLISLSMWGYHGKYEMFPSSTTSIFDIDEEMVKSFRSISEYKNTYSSLSGNIDYQRTFSKPDKAFTVSYKIDASPSSSDMLFRTEPILAYEQYRQKSVNKAHGNEHTLQVDYYNPLTEKHQIEMGLKYILRPNESDSDEKLWVAGEWVDNPDKNVLLDYTQNIFGFYGGYLFKHNKFTAKAGFRLEGSWNNGKSTTQNDDIKFDNSNFNVIPYVNLTYMLKPSQRVRFSYTQRLRRPGIWHLNPYVEKDITNPIAVSYGNPELKSVVSHSFSGSYNIFASSWNLDVRLSHSFSNNNITRYTIVKTDPESIESTYANIGKDRNWQLSLSYSYRLNTILNVYTNAHGGYYYMSAPDMNISNEGYSMNLSAGFSSVLWKNARMNISGGYQSGRINLQGKTSSNYYMGIGITQRLLKEKMDISINVSDPLTKYRKQENRQYVEGDFSNYTEAKFLARRVRIRVGYRFGKMDVQVKKARRTISNEDKMDNGGGGSSAGR